SCLVFAGCAGQRHAINFPLYALRYLLRADVALPGVRYSKATASADGHVQRGFTGSVAARFPAWLRAGRSQHAPGQPGRATIGTCVLYLVVGAAIICLI